jgi:hypothetical protein
MEHRSEARERFDRPDASVHPGSALGGPEAEKIQRNSARLQSEVRACVRVCECVSVWHAGPIRVQSIHEWTVHGPSTCRYYDAVMMTIGCRWSASRTSWPSRSSCCRASLQSTRTHRFGSSSPTALSHSARSPTPIRANSLAPAPNT